MFMNFLKLRVAYSDLERVSYEFEGMMEQFEKYIAMVDAKLEVGGYRAGKDELGREAVLDAETCLVLRD